MKRRFVVLVLDGFGIGSMDDVVVVRPSDVGANTCKSILKSNPNYQLPLLERLGIMNVLGESVGSMRPSLLANYGSIELMHEGADTFYGHQEIMGSRPKTPFKKPFSYFIDKVEKDLQLHGYDVKTIGDEKKILLVDNCVTIGDNIETDVGQAYNVTGSLDYISFGSIRAIGERVREVVSVSRVIAFGGENVDLYDMLCAIEAKGCSSIGVNAPKSGVYNQNYNVVHLGYGVDPKVQVPHILGEAGIDVRLIGKVADIVDNPYGKSEPCVPTNEVMEKTLSALDEIEKGFICVNVQETDLMGHKQDVNGFYEKLEIVDGYMEQLIKKIGPEDILIVMADHGNDPTVGHSRHTRECVPLLVYRQGLEGRKLGQLKTLSDVGQTVCDYFETKFRPENGESFLSLLEPR